MLMLGGLITVLGLIVGVIGFLGLVLKAYQESVFWLIVIFIPFAGLIFVALNWEEAKGPFWCIVLGLVIRFVGAGILSTV